MFAGSLVQDAEHSLGIAPDNRSRVALTEETREQRKEAGQLGVDYRVRILESRSDIQKEDLKYAINYNHGDVLVYSHDTKIGLQRGDRASVVQIDVDRNKVTVKREADGNSFTYDPSRMGTAVGVCEAAYREFAQGDRVQFTRNLPGKVVTNRQRGTIVALQPDGEVAVQLDNRKGKNGEPVVWRGNLADMPFLDHGYVMTSYSAQSADANRVVIHLDTDAPHTARMLTQQLIYVATSRGKHDVQIFTDNLEELRNMLYRLEAAPMALSPADLKGYRREVDERKPLQQEQGLGIAV
jgi:hypothetical protein